MSKKKKVENQEDDDLFFEELAETTNGDVLNLIDSIKYFIDTGSLALNYMCSGRFIGGGIPGGKLTEIYGPNSSSKSLLGANILFGCQRMGGIAVLEDTENSANKEFIRQSSHCNLKRIVRHTPRSLEQVFTKMYNTIKAIREKKGLDVPIVILYDSIGVSPSERELKEVGLPDDFSQADFKRIVGSKEQPGERAKICSREFRKLNTIMEESGATIIVLNQTRDAIGVFAPMGMKPKTSAGGGNSLPFYASCRIETKTQKKIEKKLTAKKKKILGINIKLKNIKNKTHRPFIESDNIQLLFDKGINPISGLLSCLLDAERIVSVSKGFAVKEPWAGGREIIFKANSELNEMPLDVLLDCPTLIDAESKEQILEYLEPFKESIDFKPEENKDIEVSDVLGEEDDVEFEE